MIKTAYKAVIAFFIGINDFFDDLGPNSRTKYIALLYALMMMMFAVKLIDVAREIKAEAAKSAASTAQCAESLKSIEAALGRLP